MPTETRDPTASLEELMEQYVDGHATAFEALYRQVSPRLLGYLLRLTRDRDRAEDLMQITFSKVHDAGLSIAEAAQVLNTTPTAVKLRAHRGYQLLRKTLEAYSRES